MSIARRTALAAAAAAVLLTAGLAPAWGAAPAKKAPKAPSISVSNSIAGAPQIVTLVAPGLAGQSVSVQFSGSSGTSALSTTLDPFGNGQIIWTPSAPGGWTVSGLGALASAPAVNVVASQLPTCATLYAPVAVGVNTITALPVQIRVPGQLAAPTGRVALVTEAGTTLSTAPLVPGAGGLSTATLIWAPESTGTWSLRTVYQPSNGVYMPSSSNIRQVQVLASAPTVAITIPSSFYVGTQTTVGALITPGTTTGSAAFLLNNSSLSGSVGTSINSSFGTPMSTVTVPWTPTFAGSQLLTAQFTSSSGDLTQQQSQAINVLPAQIPDPISLTAPARVPVGGAAAFAITTGSSGPTMAWTNSPNCALRGATVVGLMAGPCTIAVTSLGGGNYSLNSTISVVTIG